MDITNRTILKKYEYAQVNLLIDSNGNKFIEKIQFHIPPVIPLSFQYNYNELEFIESIVKPLEISHAQIINSIQNKKCTTYVMEFIDGINCEKEPKAEYLYIAAEKIGEIFSKSIMNMARIDNKVIEKYTLTKEKFLDHSKIISKYFNLQRMDLLANYIFKKYQNQPNFVNHGDMQFKNFIYNNDLHIIDWGGQIHPFYSDLQCLITQAYEVNADIEEIKKRYLRFSGISSISDEDIIIGAIVNGIETVYNLLIFDCPMEWINKSYHELLAHIPLLNF